MTDTGVEPDRGATSGPSPWQKVVGILGLLVILWVGSDTYDVIDGDFGGGGGGHTPVQNQDEETDTDTGGHTPGGHG